jgi:hypothetical protein
MLQAMKKNIYSQNSIDRAIHMVNFPEDYGNNKEYIISAIRVLFINLKRISPRILPRDTLIKKTSEFIQKFTILNDRQTIYELSDILISYAPDISENILQNLRVNEEKKEIIRVNHNIVNNNPIHPNPNVNPVKLDKNTVYGDSQNVHNSTVNKSVLTVLSNLHQKYHDDIQNKAKMLNISIPKLKKQIFLQIRHDLIRYDISKKKLIEDSFDYIDKNLAIFTDKSLTLQDSIILIWIFIENHKNKNELTNRLLEEFREMNGYCTTGHIARLISVIQGYTEEENLCIRISNNDRFIAVCRNYLNNCLKNCTDEEVLDGMLDASDVYKKFLRVCIAKKLLEWKKDFGSEVVEQITHVVNDFAKTKIFE